MKRRANGKRRAAAELHGVSVRTIGNWLKERPPYPIDGTEEERRTWRDRHHPRDGGTKAVNQTARLRCAQADLAELEAREKAGELVALEDVKATFSEALAILRLNMRGIPGRVAGPLATMADPGQIKRYVADEVDRSLAAAAQAFESWGR